MQVEPCWAACLTSSLSLTYSPHQFSFFHQWFLPLQFSVWKIQTVFWILSLLKNRSTKPFLVRAEVWSLNFWWTAFYLTILHLSSPTVSICNNLHVAPTVRPCCISLKLLRQLQWRDIPEDIFHWVHIWSDLSTWTLDWTWSYQESHQLHVSLHAWLTT